MTVAFKYLQLSGVDICPAMTSDISADQLQKAMKAIRELRASVSLVFDKLHSGVKDTDSSGDKDKSFLPELRECLSKVNTDIE